MKYDVVTFGESMLRLTPPHFERFSQASQFEIHIGGSESNTSVGLARLGLRVAWITRMTDNPLGRKITEAIAAHGVDTTHVVWTDEDRVGTYYLERGKPPRGSRVFYDRAGSAISRMHPEEFPLDLLRNQSLRVFHTTGITMGLSSSTSATAMHAALAAKESSTLISFDLNYRSKLWSPQSARQTCEVMMRLADIVFIPRRDAATVFQIAATEPRAILAELASSFPKAIIVLTLGAEGAAAINPQGDFVSQPAFPAVEVERLGGGDAFSAGFLRGWLQSGELPTALRWGAAVAALKYTIPSDLPLVDLAEVQSLVLGNSQSGVQR